MKSYNNEVNQQEQQNRSLTFAYLYFNAYFA